MIYYNLDAVACKTFLRPQHSVGKSKAPEHFCKCFVTCAEETKTLYDKVCPFVCLFVPLSVGKMTQKVTNEFRWPKSRLLDSGSH